MNINVNDLAPGALLDLTALNAKGKKADEKIRATFADKSPAISLKLSIEGKAKAQSAQSTQSAQTQAVQRQVRTGTAPVVARDLVRTGYAAIDNTIIDSLNGVSDDVRQYAYDIVRKDFLIDNAGDMSEEERQDLISLGLSEAQFIADNYLSGDNAKDFMTAIKKVAGIAARATREEDGTMDYGGIYRRDHTQNGYTVEITDSFAMMKHFRPDLYEEYKSLQKELKETHDTEGILKECTKLLSGFMNELVTEQPDAWKQFKKEGLARLEETSENDVKDTFQNVETKSAKGFIQALMQMQNKNLFSAFPFLTNRLDSVIGQFYSREW